MTKKREKKRETQRKKPAPKAPEAQKKEGGDLATSLELTEI
tara:strand:- start:177 stop:299 length:123 start_codon:yes stop_codon:yes gene_type:complete